MSRLTLYSRRGCALCEEMIEDLEPLCRHVALEIIDVDSDPALLARHGSRVPVLVADGEEVCVARLDRRALAAALASSAAPRT